MQTRELPGALKVGQQRRFVTVQRAEGAAADAAIVGEDRLLTLSFSSEQPVERWFGDEILSHEKAAADFSRLNDGAPLLWGHDWNRIIGVVEKAWIDQARGMATVRFAKTPDGDQFMAMVNDGVVRNVSFAYQVNAYRAEGSGAPDDGDEDPTYTATSWLAYEISLVSVPADQTVGVGRSEPGEAQAIPVQRRTTTHAASAVHTERIQMDPNNTAAPEAVIQQTRDEAMKAERQRISDIDALCLKHKVEPKVREGMVTGGATIAEARGTILDILAKRSGNAVADLGESPNPDLTEREKAKYSMLRAVSAALSGNWQSAGFEREVSLAIAKKAGSQESAGFYMPTNIPFYVDANRMPAQLRAQYATSAAATGGVLVGTSLLAGSFIEILRNTARVMQLGATVLSGLQGNIDIPRQVGAATAYWVGEGANPTESEATFEKLGMTPRTLGVYSLLTRNMLLQATPDIEQLARNDLLKVIALALDAACLFGTGAGGQPMGIANTSGIGSVVGGTNGAQFSIDNFIDLETQVTAANAPDASLAYLANAKTVGWVKKLKATTGTYLWTPMPLGQRGPTPGEINGYPVARSNQVRANLTKGSANGICSELYFGAWEELFVGEWGVLEVLPNPYGANYKSGGIELRALQTIDVGLRHSASFAVMSDGLTA